MNINIEINIFKNYSYFTIKRLINIIIIVISSKVNIKYAIKKKIYYIID